jgi:hypothetical protein
MRLILTLLIIPSAIFFTSLSNNKDKEQVYHNDAEIMNADKSLRPCNVNNLCNCPGGFFIHIEGVNDPHGKCTFCNSFKTMQFPEDFAMGDKPQFPIAVTIDWKYDSLSCDSSRINIIKIAKR